MSTEKREYSGAALNSFVLALGDSHDIVQKILADAGVDRIDPQRWYDLDWALSIYDRITKEVGPGAVRAVGKKMIEAAVYPPGIDNVQTLLMSLDAAFHLNARGPDIGNITCTIEDDHSATLDWAVQGPCALCIGILEGSCARYGVKALVEHAPGGCKDSGAPTCIYYVTW